jgi:RNase adaptor protein for sRNA GlmZ degradation
VSGSGKSTAVRALEDAGFFCIDNLPVVLLPQLTGLAELAQPDTRLALVIDAREGEMLRQAPGILARLRAEGHQVELMFLDASDESLVRRYSETRRRHPLASEESVPAGIARERELLTDLRDLADQVIDTSQLNVHDLKRLVMARFGESGASLPSLTVISFGYRYGVPPQADLVFDLRFLPNPYFVPELKPLTGEDLPGRALRARAVGDPGVPEPHRGLGAVPLPPLPARGEGVPDGRPGLHRREAPERRRGHRPRPAPRRRPGRGAAAAPRHRERVTRA